jgi:hypothetical protein
MTTSNPIAELMNLVPPPRQPLANQGNWASVEQSLGTALPADFKELVSVYGCGLFNDHVYLNSPFATSTQFNLSWLIETLLQNFRDNRDDEIGAWEQTKFPIYPESDGLLPFASASNGETFSWRTIGPPDDWHIYAWMPSDLSMHQTGYHSIVRFMIDVYRKRTYLRPDDNPNMYTTFDQPHFFRPVDADGPVDTNIGPPF